jgi:plasmid maintenance system antidote protein VapI
MALLIAWNGYAERIRKAMLSEENPTRATVSIHQLARLTGYSYEHVRKLVNGLPLISREFNDMVCRVLGLDPKELWALCQSEKVQRKYGMTRLPNDTRLAELWPHLTDSDREKIVRIVEGYAEANKALGKTWPNA